MYNDERRTLKKIKKIIILNLTPFNSRDYHRFGVEILLNNNFSVEVWDITQLLYPELFSNQSPDYHPPEGLEGFNYKQYRTKNSLEKDIGDIQNNTLIINFVKLSHKSAYIYIDISKQEIPYCVINTNILPNVKLNRVERIKNLFLTFGKLQLKKIFSILSDHIINIFIIKNYKFFRIEPASLCIVSTRLSTHISNYPISENTQKIFAHTMDYDIFLEKQKNDVQEDKSLAVFIDDYLPFHPDFKMNNNIYPVTPEKYYPKIVAFFDYLEKMFGVHIIIAAHPRSEYEKLPDFFGGRKCIKGHTDDLIRKSAFVISHNSTAINFAILYHKPIIFITTNEYSQKKGTWQGDAPLKSMSTLLKKSIINIDNSQIVDWKNEMSVNNQAYSEYIETYIKESGTPEIPIWEIFSRYIKNK